MIIPTPTSYSDKDFDMLVARLHDVIRSVHPSWTDEARASFANVILQSFAFVGDVQHYYQDQNAREARWAWMKLRRSAIALGKMIDYTLDGATAASGDVTVRVTNASALTGIVTQFPVGKPVVVRTEDPTNPIRGELQSAVSINVGIGETEVTVPWRHALTQPVYTVAASGKQGQQIYLPFGPFLDGSEVVSTPTQPVWTRVNDFLRSGSADCHYRVQVDHLDRATIIFGDGLAGAMPLRNISVAYETGGGIDGNLPVGALKRCDGSFIDGAGHPAYVEVVNAAATSGGYPREEVSAARYNGPESLRALTRTVAREDYEIHAKTVPEIGRACMLTSNEVAGIGENRGELYCMTKDGEVPSSSVLAAVKTACQVTLPSTITFQLEVRGVIFHKIDVYAVIWLTEGSLPSTVKAAIQANLAAYLEPMLANGGPNPAVGFGYEYQDVNGLPTGEIPWSHFINIIIDSVGVRKVGAGATDFTLNGERDDVSVPLWKFPQLGTVT
ncbi:MAG: baseplate J/gp47 family protein, partial [Spirochaetes bacterium]|nr:baseplate J/gp47 family protein [Spirochaetota bacterium]